MLGQNSRTHKLNRLTCEQTPARVFNFGGVAKVDNRHYAKTSEKQKVSLRQFVHRLASKKSSPPGGPTVRRWVSAKITEIGNAREGHDSVG